MAIQTRRGFFRIAALCGAISALLGGGAIAFGLLETRLVSELEREMTDCRWVVGGSTQDTLVQRIDELLGRSKRACYKVSEDLRKARAAPADPSTLTIAAWALGGGAAAGLIGFVAVFGTYLVVAWIFAGFRESE